MIQSITDSIVKAIKTEYGKSYRVYDESVEQGLIEPCFSVLCLNPSSKHEVGDRARRYFPFMITYFPSTNTPIAECNAVCETLMCLLATIDTDIGVIHASDDISGQIVDGNLQFSVQYDLFAMIQHGPVDDMADLTVDTTTM